jgi:hypothetical protein
MSLELHEWDIHIVCFGTSDAKVTEIALAPARRDDKPCDLIPGDLVVARGSVFSATRTPRARSAPAHDHLAIAGWWLRRL